MSDSFADLWNTTAPPKPTLQKLASSSPQLNNTARRPQNDVFSMLSSAASTPNNSRPITPNARPIAQQKPAQASSAGGDAFSSLLGGTLSSNGNGMANMTIAERARRVELERQRKANAPPPASTAGSAWDGLDSLAAGPSSSTATPASAALLDDDWGFGSAPIAASTSPAPPKVQPVVVVDEEDDWGLGLGSASHTATPPPPSTAPPTKGPALWDHLDDFASAKPSPPARFASPTADFDFGDRENNDDFDLLGDLGKPVSAISSRRPSPQQTPSPAEPPARRKPTSSASPPPHILGQLIEMGFSIPQSRAALAQVHRDGTWDVQAALDSLLASTGGAEGSSRTATPPSIAAPPPPRRRPSERERGSPQPAAAAVPSVLQSDLLARTSEIGFSLFKNAERAWLQGKEKVQKAYEERMMGAEEVKADRTGGSGGGRGEQRARPKWMQQDREGPEDAGGPSVGRRRDDSRQLFQDEARGKDDGWGDAPTGGWKDEDEEAAPKPATQPADLFSIDAPAKPYVSPFRHGKGRAAAPAVRAVPAPAPAPAPQATAPPPRPHIPVSPAALQTSRTHAAAAAEKIALGQYGAALSAATRAVDALPTGHVLRVPLLCLRALALLKEGDFRGVEADAGEVEGICGQGQVGREAVVVEGTGVDLGAAVVEVWKRRGEALEGRERWEEAGRDWERVAGAGWARQADRDEGVRGAGRCRRMAAPVPAAPASKPKPKPKAPPHTAASGEALANLRQATNAQEEEDAARHQLKDAVDGKLLAWKGGKETNVRALLASLETVLWPELGLPASGMKDLVTPGQVKVRYVKAIAKLHPDKLNANNSTLEQRMIANGVFGALNEAWNAFK